MSTTISWTDETWNPTTGCSKVSEGCRHCYAERLSLVRGWSTKPWTSQNEVENVRCHPARLAKPRSWAKNRMVFVDSMSDLMHRQVPDSFIQAVIETMGSTPRHIYQILTKRPERLHLFSWPPNVWLGVSVEDAQNCHRLEILRQVASSVRFVSFEPLLDAIDPDLSGIHWAIVGGESGPGFRPMADTWATQIKEISAHYGTAFYFKQHAGFRPGLNPTLGGRKYRAYPDGRTNQQP